MCNFVADQTAERSPRDCEGSICNKIALTMDKFSPFCSKMQHKGQNALGRWGEHDTDSGLSFTGKWFGQHQMSAGPCRLDVGGRPASELSFAVPLTVDVQ